MQVDLKVAQQFLDLLTEGEPVTFQLFHHVSGQGHPEHFHGTLLDYAQKLIDKNTREQMGIFVMVNQGDGAGRKNENVQAVRALFLDLDGAPIEPIHACPIEPHIITESSPGRYQVFWLVNNCPLERFKNVQRALAIKFEGDESINDLSRVMRIPGFYHLKNTAYCSKLLKCEAFQPYEFQSLIKGLGLEEIEQQVTHEKVPELSDTLKSKIPNGYRHKTLLRYAAKYAHQGILPEAVAWIVEGINRECCETPVGPHDLKRIIDRAIEYAREEGAYLPPVNYEDLLRTLPAKNNKEPTLAVPEELITNAPGLVGEIAAWINRQTIYYHPALALAISLSFVGAIKGHKVKSPTNLRTNIMTVGVALTGSGKSFPLNLIEELAEASGHGNIMRGEPASNTAVLTLLSEARNRALVVWDEFGLALSEMTANNAGSWRAAILRVMMALFSKAGSVYRGTEYANHDGKQMRRDLDQPCLSVYGTSTPGRFFEALSSRYIVDGFLPRWLVFETGIHYPDKRKVLPEPPPEALIRKCKYWSEVSSNPGAKDLEERVLVINPGIVPYGFGVEDYIDDCERFYRKRMKDSQENEAAVALWARATEHMIKIALTCSDDSEISLSSVEWAFNLVTALIGSLTMVVTEKMSESKHESMVKKMLEYIKAGAEAGRKAKDLTLKFSQLKGFERRDMLDTLIQSDQIECAQVITKTKPTTVYWLKNLRPAPESTPKES